jgi:hypothetical protein
MGYSQKRKAKKGTRYTAVYFDIRGRRFSAGTFSNRKDADDAWQDATRRPVHRPHLPPPRSPRMGRTRGPGRPVDRTAT